MTLARVAHSGCEVSHDTLPRIMRFGIVSLIMVVAVGGMSGVAYAQDHVPRVLYLSSVAPTGAFAHPSRVHAGEVIAALGQSSGAFTATVTEDLGQLSPANLATYDAVIFFTAGNLPIGDIEKNALLQFVSSGKGFIGVHSATDTFYDWPAYGDMIGAYFENHPWDQAATIRVEDQTHRSTRHLGAAFTITDELYQVRNWSRANVHVLLSLDLTSVPPGGTRADSDYALAWTKSYGAGRVFYSALGHHPEVWDDPRFQQHILGGIRWALGDADLDADEDGLPDAWETTFGLDRHSATGDNGPNGDPDHDGATNAQELAAGTHPRGLHQRYLAEGATGVFFDTRIALLNPDPTSTAHVQLRFLPESGSIVTTEVTMAPQSRHTVFVDDVPGMASASFSTLVDADQPVIVDRTMTWAFGQAYGSHAETSVAGPATTWYFAEGATHGNFDLFYLIQNPSPTQTAQVTASYLPPDGQAIEKTYEVAPNHRFTIEADKIPGLEVAEFAAAFTSTNGVPVIVERAMYLSTPDQVWAGGHDSAGATSLATRWFLAEGATGGFFHTFVLVGNPNARAAELRMTYLRFDGATVVRTHSVAAHGRLTINLATEDKSLEQTELSTIVESTNGVPVVVERAQWWPSTAPFWYEGHGSMGTTETGTQWALADGEAGGPQNAKTYVLVATADGPPTDSLKLTVFVEGGAPIARVYENRLTPNRRFTIDLDGDFPELTGHRFGVLAQSLGGMPLVVERAMYHDANGVFWAAGTNVVATRIQ
jgi:type 1 glutamine amidotransferase